MYIFFFFTVLKKNKKIEVIFLAVSNMARMSERNVKRKEKRSGIYCCSYDPSSFAALNEDSRRRGFVDLLIRYRHDLKFIYLKKDLYKEILSMSAWIWK